MNNVSVGWVLGLLVLVLSVLMLFLKVVGIFPLDGTATILFVFAGLLGLARLT